MSKVRIYSPAGIVGEFKNSFPDVKLASGVSLKELTAGDADPFFVTLPVAEVGLTSANGILYDKYLVDEMEAQIVAKRPDALMGHLPDYMRGSAYPATDEGETPLAGMWVGAQRVGKVLWGKAYIQPGKIREYFARKKATGGKIGTSIYGMAIFEDVKDGVQKLTDFVLETLDFAPADRASLKLTGDFTVTAEMRNEIVKPVVKEINGIEVVANREYVDTLPAEILEVMDAKIQRQFGIPYADLLTEIEAGKTPLTAGQRLKIAWRLPGYKKLQEFAKANAPAGDPADLRTPAGQAALKERWNL